MGECVGLPPVPAEAVFGLAECAPVLAWLGDCSADFDDCYGTLMAKMCPEWWDWCMPNDALISCTPIDDKE